MDRTEALNIYLQTIPEWKDASRRNALFGSFPLSRETNPESWDSRLGFWQNLIIDLSERGLLGVNCLCINGSLLNNIFKTDGIVPLGIPTNESIRQEKFIELNTFFKQGKLTWLSWIIDQTIVRPFTWGFRRLSETIVGPVPSEKQTFVLVDLVKSLATKFMQSYSEPNDITDLLMTFENFHELMVGFHPKFSELDSKILLNHLIRYNGFLVSSLDASKSENEMDNIMIRLPSKANVFSKMDETCRGIVQIKRTIKTLNEQIQQLTVKEKAIMAEIKKYLGQNQKHLAKVKLVQHKEIQSIQTKRLTSIATLESVLMKIHSCHSDTEILNAYEVGTKTLQTTLTSNNLSAEKVDETMDRLQDVLADHNEIENVMLERSKEAFGDLSELESELEELMRQELELSMPSVPVKEVDDMAQLLDNMNIKSEEKEEVENEPEEKMLVPA